MTSSSQNSTAPVIRLAHLNAFTAFLYHVGARVERHLRHQKLPILVSDPNAFLPLSKVWSFFAAAAQHEDEAIGWLVGDYVGRHNLHAQLLRKLENCSTLYQALKLLVKLVSVEASHLQIGIQERRCDVLFYTHYSGMSEVPGYMISQAYQLEVYLHLIRHFLGPDWIPYEIGIEQSQAPTIVEKHFPGSRLLTQQPVGYIAVPRVYLHSAPRRATQKAYVGDDLILSEKFDFLDTLKALLESYLPDGYPNAGFVAELMGVSERTLARRLSARGLTYGTVIDEVRFETAKSLLQKPGVRIGDVSAFVGFDNQSNFTRMFRRIGGLNPAEFRKQSLIRSSD